LVTAKSPRSGAGPSQTLDETLRRVFRPVFYLFRFERSFCLLLPGATAAHVAFR